MIFFNSSYQKLLYHCRREILKINVTKKLVAMFVLSSSWRLRRFRAFASTFNAIRRSSFLQSNAIYALSSGFGKCGVSVIRVSGRQTRDALLALSKRKRLPSERKAVVMDLFHPVNNQQLDRGLILWFKGETNLS